MNKRHEPLSAQAKKKEKKEVLKGIKEASLIKQDKTCPTIIAKKPSKPAAKTPADSPQHVKTEGSRWVSMLRKQSAENLMRETKKQLKAH